MKKLLSILLSLILLSTGVCAAIGESPYYGAIHADRPMQSETEFVVALDPDYADQVLSGEVEFFIHEDSDNNEISAKNGANGNKNQKKVPPGLLKKESEGKEEHIRNIERYRARHLGDVPVLITVEVENSGKMQEARDAVEMCEGVLYTDPLAYYYADDFSDPRADEQWGLAAIDAFDVWSGNSLLSSVTIAIVDSGVRMSHEDLSASIVPGWDFVGHDPDPTDEHGHGTHVAGISAAISNNGVGIASPAGGAKIMPVRVLDASGQGTVIGVSDGIRYAADNGADIINLSIGGDTDTFTLRSAVEYAINKGCLVVAAAGNDNSTQIGYPARYAGVLIAASISISPNPDYLYAESYFSNYNDSYASRTIHAPGEKILSTYYTHDSAYQYLSGTSMATPYISGMAAAIKTRGGYGGSLFNAMLNATVTMPRAMLNSSGGFWRVSGEMNVLNDNGSLAMPDYSGQLYLTVTPSPATSYVVQAQVTARNILNVIDTSFSGQVNISFERSGSFYTPSFGTHQNTTYVQQIEIINGIGTAAIDLTGYKNNDTINLRATDPSGQFNRSVDVTLRLSNAVAFKGYNVEIKLDKPDSYTGPESLPTGSESFDLQIYLGYYESIDSDEPPTGMASAGVSEGRLKWDPVSLQYKGVLNLPRGKVQLYYYVYYNGYDTRYPDPQPIGEPIVLTSDMSLTGKLLPHEYSVTFETNGGEPDPAAQYLPEGGFVTPPATINREGYSFIDWYSTSDFSGAPYSFLTPVTDALTLYAKWEQNPPNCRIGPTIYNTLSECLAAAESGDTIVLLSDILYRQTMSIKDKELTIDLNGYFLDVVFVQTSPANGAGLYVENGELRLTGDGELNVKSTAQSGYGLRAVNSVVEITNALGTNNASGVRAEDGSDVTVFGTSRGLGGVECVRNSLVTIHGDVIGYREGPQNRSSGVSTNNSDVIVYGDIIADDAISMQGGSVVAYGDVYGGEGYYSSGISNTRGSVTIYGNVTTGMSGVKCAGYEIEATVTIKGNLTCTYPDAIGIEISGSGDSTVIIDGVVKAASFAKLFNASFSVTDRTEPTTKTGYWTFIGEKSGATATLWVKERDKAFITGEVLSYNPKVDTTITLYEAGSFTEVVATTMIEALAEGSGQINQMFWLDDVSVGIYDLVVTKGGHLSYTITNIVVDEEDVDLTLNTTKAYSTIVLPAGDVNNDGRINVNDVTYLLIEYNKAPTVWPYADIDGSGTVNVQDITYLLVNYNKVNTVIPY